MERPSNRSPAVTYTLGILLAYNAWQLLQWGLIGSAAIWVSATIDIDDPETAEAMSEEGITPQQFKDINQRMTQWVLATASTRIVMLGSVIWIFRSSRLAYYVFATMTPIIFFVNLFGGDSVLVAGLDLAAFASLSVALFAGVPQQWLLLE